MLIEENNDLKEDIQRFKRINYDQHLESIETENQELRRRNGELLVKMTDMTKELQELKS